MHSPLANLYSYSSWRGLSVSAQTTETINGETVFAPTEYINALPLWTTLRDIHAGTNAVKSKGEAYLRKLSAHSNDEYSAYLHRAPFYNGVRRTHEGLMGSLFRREAEHAIPEVISRLLGDKEATVTTCGRTLPELEKYAASELLLVGRFGILVDLPAGASTNPAPMLSLYQAEDIFSWRTRLFQGKKIVDRIILREAYETPTSYSIERSKVIRVLKLDPDANSPSGLTYSQEVFWYDEKNELLKSEAVTPSVRGLTLGYIPFEFLNVDDLRPDVSTPPMLDLAMMNLEHYESSALLSHALFYAGMPTYYIAGDADDPLVPNGVDQSRRVGPSSIWHIGKDEKAGLIEFTGHGLTFLENAVQDKQSQMQALGGRLITSQRRTASLTAEAYGVMEMSDQNILMCVAQTLERAITRSLRHYAALAGITLAVADLNRTFVEVNKEFDNGELSARELRAIQSLYERGLIPLDVLYYTLRQVGVIPMEYSLDEFKSLLGNKDQIYVDPKLELEKQRQESADRAAREAKRLAESHDQQGSQELPDQTV